MNSALQNGFWFFKLAAVIALAVGGFYLPTSFPIYWMYICIAASTVYIVIQVIQVNLLSKYLFSYRRILFRFWQIKIMVKKNKNRANFGRTPFPAT